MRSPHLALSTLLLPALALLGGCRVRVSQAAENAPTAASPDAGSPDAAVRASSGPSHAWIDPSPHLSEDVDLDGLHLNYLDWGGIGPALVMIHGLGGNPHIFDDLAPLLREHLHVLAYARRGHGDSDGPAKGPYDLKTLVADLGRLLDHLNIGRAHLLGLSTGGNEITRFAAEAPDRVGKLVYLDAAYDWSDPTFLAEFGKMVAANSAEKSDLLSLDAYRAWFSDVWLGRRQPWTSGLDAYVRDRVRIGEDGRIAPRMPGPVQKASFEALSGAPQAYARVHAPALALYAATFFPVDSPNPGRAWLARDFERRVAAPWRAASEARARRELGGVTVRRLDGTTHVSIGVHDVEALAAVIEEFLADDQVGDAAAP